MEALLVCLGAGSGFLVETPSTEKAHKMNLFPWFSNQIGALGACISVSLVCYQHAWVCLWPLMSQTSGGHLRQPGGQGWILMAGWRKFPCQMCLQPSRARRARTDSPPSPLLLPHRLWVSVPGRENRFCRSRWGQRARVAIDAPLCPPCDLRVMKHLNLPPGKQFLQT